MQFSTAEVVGDNFHALSVNTGLGARLVRHVGLLGLTGAAINGEDVVSAGLGSVNLGTPGHFTLTEDASVSLTPLLMSSPQSAPIPAGRFQFLPDPGELLDDFSATGESYILAARFDAQQTVEFAAEPVDEELGVTAEEDPGLDPRAEADAINSTVAGWRYQIPSYKYDQMTRRMSDLLQAPEEDE